MHAGNVVLENPKLRIYAGDRSILLEGFKVNNDGYVDGLIGSLSMVYQAKRRGRAENGKARIEIRQRGLFQPVLTTIEFEPTRTVLTTGEAEASKVCMRYVTQSDPFISGLRTSSGVPGDELRSALAKATEYLYNNKK